MDDGETHYAPAGLPLMHCVHNVFAYRKHIVAVCTSTVIACLACRTDIPKTPRVEKSLALFDSLDAQYEVYVNGSVDEARSALSKCEPIIARFEVDQEKLRFLIHARLYCIARAFGQDDEAMLEFVRAKYWRLERIMRDYPKPEWAGEIRKFTEYECARIVVAFDQKYRKGKGPRYWELLPGGPIRPQEWLKSLSSTQTGLEQ